MVERWGVYLYWRSGMTPVTFCAYVAFSDTAAMQFGQALLFVCNKKRGWYIKEFGVSKRFSRRRYPDTDETKKRRKRQTTDEPVIEQPLALPAPVAAMTQQIKMWDDETWQTRQKKRRL